VYMPDCWAKDAARRKKAGIPGKLAFATKPELAVAQVRRLMAAGVRAMRAAAGEVHGRCGEFRAALRELSLAYVVIIPCDYRVTLARDTVIRADAAIARAVFERRSCGNGTKGPRYGDWALIATASPREFLLIRRFPDRDKNQYAFYLCWAPEGRPATMTYFITIAGRRWPVVMRSVKVSAPWRVALCVVLLVAGVSWRWAVAGRVPVQRSDVVADVLKSGGEPLVVVLEVA